MWLFASELFQAFLFLFRMGWKTSSWRRVSVKFNVGLLAVSNERMQVLLSVFFLGDFSISGTCFKHQQFSLRRERAILSLCATFVRPQSFVVPGDLSLLIGQIPIFWLGNVSYCTVSSVCAVLLALRKTKRENYIFLPKRTTRDLWSSFRKTNMHFSSLLFVRVWKQSLEKEKERRAMHKGHAPEPVVFWGWSITGLMLFFSSHWDWERAKGDFCFWLNKKRIFQTETHTNTKN